MDYYDELGNEIPESYALELYDDMIDDVYGEHMGLLSSEILKNTDPIAYRVGFHEYIDAQISDGLWYESDPTAEEDE